MVTVATHMMHIEVNLFWKENALGGHCCWAAMEMVELAITMAMLARTRAMPSRMAAHIQYNWQWTLFWDEDNAEPQ